MKFEDACKNVATEYTELTASGMVAASTDWISLVTQIGAILIPLIQQCMEKRRTAKGVAESAKSRPFLTRLAVRQKVMDHFNQTEETGYDARRAFRAKGDALVNAIMKSIDSHDEATLVSVIQDAADDA